MGPVSIVGVFCEDIREEKQGTDTVIGILPDTISIGSFPAGLPKLGMYVRAHVDVKHRPSPIEIRLVLGKDQPDVEVTVLDSELIRTAQEQAVLNGAQRYGIVCKAVFVMFNVKSPGRINAIARVDDREIEFASLRINEATDGA